MGKSARMPRAAKVAPGGVLFHVLNRGVGRMELFSKPRKARLSPFLPLSPFCKPAVRAPAPA